MIITWYGQACFKLQSGDLTIAIDPFAKEIGLVPPRFKTDIILVTHPHMDHSNVETFPEGAFIIKGAGEYEMKGVYVKGISTFHDNVKGKDRGLNTAYAINIEGLRIVHLGDYGEDDVRDEVLEEAGNIDILMIPVGGKYTIDGEKASQIVSRFEPKIIIPMHYKIPGLKVGLDDASSFLKEMSAEKNEVQDKLVIKKKDLEESDKMEVVILKPIASERA